MAPSRISEFRAVEQDRLQRAVEEQEGATAMFQATLGQTAERRVSPAEGAELQVEERALSAARRGSPRMALHRSTFRVSAPAAEAQALAMSVQHPTGAQGSDDPKGRPSRPSDS